MTRRHKTFILWLIVWLVMTALLGFLFNHYFSIAWWILFFAATNFSAFCLYGWDKLAAGQRIDRVPEVVLYFAVLGGGAIGALLGMKIFHHKTSKTSFQIVVALIILVQLVLIIFLNQKFNFFPAYLLQY